jgi:CheY-like chemotaxis protein
VVSVANSKRHWILSDVTVLGQYLGGKQLSVLPIDLEMPIMDDMACVRRIGELHAEGKIWNRVPVIAVTVNARKDNFSDAIAAGTVITAGILS